MAQKNALLTLRLMLAELVREAKFLVEENLGVLVERHEDIDEFETDIFKLDSILSAVGVDCEEEVLAVLKKREHPSKAKEGILKIIRLVILEHLCVKN